MKHISMLMFLIDVTALIVMAIVIWIGLPLNLINKIYITYIFARVAISSFQEFVWIDFMGRK